MLGSLHGTNAYVLTLDKSGFKMKVNDQPQSYTLPIHFSGIGVMNGVRVPMPYFCWTLGQILQQDERPVVDRTGLAASMTSPSLICRKISRKRRMTIFPRKHSTAPPSSTR